MEIDAVLFDFDGTLAPNLDLPGMRRDVIEFTQSWGVPSSVWQDLYIVEVIDASAEWLKSKGAQAEQYFEDAHRIILDIELAQAEATDPFPGVPAYLRQLKSAGLKIGVVTRNIREAVLNTYPELLNDVHVLAARDDVTHIKPDPRHLLACLNDLGCEPERSAMVGDGALDMSTGQSLGLHCVGVLSGSSDAPRLVEAGADVVYDIVTEYLPE